MKSRVIILDFDGVVVESVGIKDRAFRSLFKDYPGYLDAIMEYHLSHNATVRFDKFKHITEDILGREYNEKIKIRLSEEFSRLVFDEIVRCPYVSGAEDFLKFFHGKVPLYVASASPAEELAKIIEKRGLEAYFKKVYAIPWVKKDIIRDILANENILPEEAVFVGDSFEDFKAAQETDIFFIGRYSNKSFNNVDVPIFRDLFEVKKFIEEGERCNLAHGSE